MMHRPESQRFPGEHERGPRQPQRCRFDIRTGGEEKNRRDQRQRQPGPLSEEPGPDAYRGGRVSLRSTEIRRVRRVSWDVAETGPPRICLATLSLRRYRGSHSEPRVQIDLRSFDTDTSVGIMSD